MSLAVVRSLHEVRRPSTPEELDDLEQEVVDQYALAGVSAGVRNASIAAERAVIFEFVRYLGRRVWTATTEDADRFLAYQRRELRRAHSTVRGKALVLARFYEYLLACYQGEIHAATGYAVEQVIDEFNKPGLVRQTLRVWLDERARRWPTTSNAHMFVTEKTAVRITPVGSEWVSGCRAVPAQAIREDRILEEARITRGDERRLVDLFGLTVEAAMRYTRTIETPTADGEPYRVRT